MRLANFGQFRLPGPISAYNPFFSSHLDVSSLGNPKRREDSPQSVDAGVRVLRIQDPTSYSALMDLR